VSDISKQTNGHAAAFDEIPPREMANVLGGEGTYGRGVYHLWLDTSSEVVTSEGVFETQVSDQVLSESYTPLGIRAA